MKNKILEMLEMQDNANTVINPDWKKAGNEWYRAVWIELAELTEHHGWKWWKKQKPDMEQLKLEIVDIVHFALSSSIERSTIIERTAESIAEDFNNPSLVDIGILELVEHIVVETILRKTVNYRLISSLMELVDMSFDELYVTYVGKNILNIFRQEHGYKEGTYIKEWDGKEDNEHLTEIISNLNSDDQDFRQKIQDKLNNTYPG